MYVVGKRTTYAARFLFCLFVTNSAFPTIPQVFRQTAASPISETLGHDNETLIRLPNGIPWSQETATVQNGIPYPIPNTTISLNFNHFGVRIPVVRALSTIFDAHHRVLSHLVSDSENATAKNEIFEYRTHSAPPAPFLCSVVVQAYRGLGLSWLQLDQILRGLTDFSSGAGSDHQPHYQALGFEISLSDEGRRGGIGGLWCTPNRGRGKVKVEERASLPIAGQELAKKLDLVPGLSYETSSNSSKTSRLLLSSAAEVYFPVPGTSNSLAFIWLGNPLPSEMVNKVLHGAFLKIAPFLDGSGSEPIPHNTFYYWTAVSKVKIAIQIFGTTIMSWSQVNCVIAGLFQFTNGIGTRHQEEHFRNMGFIVKDQTGESIGYGDLLGMPLYDSDAVSAVDEKRSTPVNPTLPLLHNLSNSSRSLSTIPLPWRRHIYGTDFTLICVYMGAHLPPGDVSVAIQGAQTRIKPAIRLCPNVSIPDRGFENHAGTVQVTVAAFAGAEISWWQLGEVLTGLYLFCAPPYNRLLVFNIEVANRGIIGAGKVWPYEGRASAFVT